MSLETSRTAPPKAYSYLRFSTPEQSKGDSFRRQHKMAADYAALHGLELDDTLSFHDLGVSSFRGQNVTEGKLGYFLEAVRSGEVPEGSYLLVESLDRISRQNTRRALRVLEDIADLGIIVVTLNDRREYSKESLDRDPTDLLLSILQFMRANEESETKARRLKEAWAAKRSRLGTKPLTSKVPAWLRLDPESGRLELIPERAAIVERIFRETLAGQGQHQIAYALNQEGVKPWGRGDYWQRSYLAKILDSEAVIGTFTPHTQDYVEGKKVRTPQDPVPGYFPVAISEELWNEVRAYRDGKQPRSRGRNASAPLTNMLAGLASCPLCGGTMTRTNKGSRSRPSYVCVRAKSRAGCSYRSVRVSDVEEAILTRLPERLRDAPAGTSRPGAEALDREIENKEAELGQLRDRIDALLEAIEQGGETGALVGRLRSLEGDFEEARDALRKLEDRRAATAGQTVHARIARLLGALEPEDGEPQVQAVNAALHTVFQRVVIDYRHGGLVCEWLHGGDVEVPYAMPSG